MARIYKPFKIMGSQKTSSGDKKHKYLNPSKFYKFWLEPVIKSIDFTDGNKNIVFGYSGTEKQIDYYENMIAEQKKRSKSLTQFEK